MIGLIDEQMRKERLTALNFNMKSAYNVLRPLYLNEQNGNARPFYLSYVSKQSGCTESQITRYRDIGLVKFEKQGRYTLVLLTRYGRNIIKAFLSFIDNESGVDETTKGY